MRKRWWIGIVLVLLMIFGEAMAATPQLSFTWEHGGNTLTVNAWTKKDKQMHLFLPGFCDAESFVLGLSGRDVILWNDEFVKDGSSVTLPRETESVQVKNEKGSLIAELTIHRGSEVPVIFINMDPDDFKYVSKNKHNDIQEECHFLLTDEDGETDHECNLKGFHLRGNSTRFAGKKPYQLKLPEKAKLAGMKKGKKWILLANWFDISLLRNQITYDLSRDLGLENTPDCRQVDLYVNGDYLGLYLLTEKVQIAKNRVNITDMEDGIEKLNGDALDDAVRVKGRLESTGSFGRWFEPVEEPEDVTGGFLLEMEKELHYSKNEEDAGFKTESGICVVIKEPAHPGKQAVEYIARVVNNFHNAVIADDGKDPLTDVYYADMIDLDSFAFKSIVEEFTANLDFKAASQFMYKDSDSVDPLLHAGPAWDYDLTFGNHNEGLLNPGKVGHITLSVRNDTNLWYCLFQHEDFRKRTRELIEEKMIPLMAVLNGEREGDGALKSVVEYADDIRASAEMNFVRWSARTVEDIVDESGRTFEDAVDYLQDWIAERSVTVGEKWLVDE